MAESTQKRRSSGRRAARMVIAAIGVVLATALLAGGGLAIWGLRRTRASLPVLDGEIRLAGLAGEVTVVRDAQGIPVIRGGSRLDVARATGFLHAQERFFQMDLMRRRAAGELSELLGPGALDVDAAVRVHRFRHRANGFLAAGPAEHRVLLSAYVEGVNAGLEALAAPPFEYMFVRGRPRPWEEADSILVGLAMYLNLQGRDQFVASSLGVLFDTLPQPLAEFLAPRGTEWDAPIVGEPFAQPLAPGPEVTDLRSGSQAAQLSGVPGGQVETTFPGSNNWAVAGEHTAHGGALVANDMHLGLGVPPTWYRVVLEWPDVGGAAQHRVVGVTLPGTPMVVAGSNTKVAWGFTNSYGDWVDLVILEACEDEPDGYLAPDGCLPFAETEEVIRVRGGGEETITVRETVWGPVVDEDHAGRLRAMRWVAHDPDGVNLNLVDMETAPSLEDAIDVAATAGIAAQNMVLGDDTGRIAWVLAGRIPNRRGCDGRLPASWADGRCGWDGYLPPENNPRLIDPELGRLWSANSRVVSGEMYTVIGDGGYDLGARAGQIRDGLLAMESADETDMLALQLDDRALFLERWRDLLAQVLAASDGGEFAEAGSVLDTWQGRAATDCAAYRLVRAWRFKVGELALEPLAVHARELVEEFSVRRFTQWEGPLWALLEERPLHLLSPEFESWDHMLREALQQTVAELTADGTPLADQTWGRRNTVRVRHPLSRFVPMLGARLDMPPVELPGDMNLPRVQGVGFGASQRMVVSPGREEQGIFHMPAGQSGHPTSPYYREGHQAWIDGEPTPLLPGPPVHTLHLLPAE